jgi:type I restriction enzyme S subunit
MTLKVFQIDFNDIAKDFFLRSDFDYFEIKNNLKLDEVEKLKKYILFIETGKPITPEDYSVDETDNVHITVRNIVDGSFIENNLIYINDDKAIEFEKNRIQKNDIVIAISSNCGFSFYYDGNDKRNLTLSHYLARFRVDESFINPLFLNYYINSKMIKQYFRSVETGKTLKNLSKYYIKELPILIPDKNKQDSLLSEIEPIEKKIKELKANILPTQVIINKILGTQFDFDLNEIYKIEKNKIFYISDLLTYRNLNLRSSVRWHKIIPIQNEIYKNITCVKKLGRFINSTQNGWSPNCKENDTLYNVFNVSSISQNGVINYEELKSTDETKSNIEEYFATEGDFFVSRGNTVDLVALASVVENIEEDKSIIFSDLFIKVNFDENHINKKYMAYIFNSNNRKTLF